MPHANLEIFVDDRKTKQIVHGDEESHKFYSEFEAFSDMSSIEAPLSQEIFNDLISLFYSVNVCSMPAKDKRNSGKRR